MNSNLTLILISLLGFLVVVLLGALWSGYRTIAGLNRAVDLVSRSAGIPSYRQALVQLPKELARARRYQRPFTVAVLRPESAEIKVQENGTADVNQTNEFRTSSNRLKQSFQARLVRTIAFSVPFIGHVLRDVIRESDIITYDASRSLYILALPDISKSQSQMALRRLQETAVNSSLVQLRVGVAEFPSDGLTIEDLVIEARLACDGLDKETEIPAADGAAASLRTNPDGIFNVGEGTARVVAIDGKDGHSTDSINGINGQQRKAQ